MASLVRVSGENLESLRCFDEDGKPKSIFLTDTDSLDCLICCELLAPPVFQCVIGHAACSIYCTKLKNRCPYCFLGFIRHRTVEKALESAKVLCPNSKYGCEEILIYNRSHHHKCLNEPCSCPLSGCKYAAQSSQLYKHFNEEHKKFALQFRFNKVFNVTLYANKDYSIILQEEEHGLLLILKKTVEKFNEYWNKISVFRIGSPIDEKVSFRYSVEVCYEAGWTVPLPSLPVSSRNKDYDKAEADQFTFYFEVSKRRSKLALRIGDLT